MKQLFQYNRLTGLLLCAVALLSCKKEFLEINPKGKLIASKTLEYESLLYGAPYHLSIQPTIAMGDEVAAIKPYFTSAPLANQRSFQWADDLYDAGVSAPAEYKDHMLGLYRYNKVINEVMASTEGTEQQKIALHADALACRALTYFSLINLYGKPYNAGTSATDPGVPIITKADVTEATFTRASVKEVYDFIVADLTAAIPNLPVETMHRLRMSRPAAAGLLGKVYVFMGKYNEALVQLNASLAGMSSSSIPVGLYDYNVTFGPGGDFLPIGSFGPRQPDFHLHKESYLRRMSSDPWTFFNNEIIINPQTFALFGSSDTIDLRLNFYSTKPVFSGTNYLTAGMKMLRRTGPSNAPTGVLVPDLYLLRAECKARLNDLAGAESDVETLRKNRIKATGANGTNPAAEVPSTIASDRKALVKFILEERIREFAVQGYRWQDMRRLSVDSEFSSTVGITHALYKADGTVESTFTLKPDRLVLRLPLIIIERNSGMQNNP